MPPAGPARLIAFFFRPEGRIGRAEYGLGLAFIYSASAAILLAVLAQLGPVWETAPIAMLLALPLTVAMFVLVAKRCHDLGLPGSYVLLLAVPLVGLVWLLALLILPGSAGPNPYGPPPEFRPD
jgi:uncharacterized membrane protein YhaH (DUF805 family)